MSVKVECDRCGELERTEGMVLFARLIGPGIPKHQVPLPDGWTRPALPTEDGELRERELCPQCQADLLRFMGGAVLASDLDDGRMESPDQVCPHCQHLRHAEPCPDPVPEVGPCGCKIVTPRGVLKELGIGD